MSSDSQPSELLTSEEEILNHMMEQAGDADLRVPPRCYEEMNAELLAFDPGGETLRARFPVEERYENPMGVMQGGFVSAAFDNVLGPLSYLVAPPSATTQMNLTFLRPVTRQHEHIEIEARLDERAGKTLQLSATAVTPSDETVATCMVTCRILRNPSSR